ncbi:glycosyl hydrolase [Microbacterium jejuense]|uniref:glycosyl hydrolase n=1 Tax=Microbacterium jejuense TaxID=1263637 RepID=UPI0031E70214
MNRPLLSVRTAITTAAAATAATALVLGGLAPAASAAAPAPASPAATASVDLVDDAATPETRSLFAYLRDVRGTSMLFGHQHTTDYGESFAVRDGVSSDVKAATGDYPAVFGFDGLIIEGRERPGIADAPREQNALTLAQSIREAHDLGGISTLSAHIENFVTGGDFYDTSGDTLRAVLPGGAKNADLTAYLDLVALAATNAVDADGTPIPIVFRPWHENAGSWFWWGAAFGTPGEYAELYRYTVEYLRDVKGVHNLLYAFSPGGGFGGDAELYLRTYPGDDFVDLLGYDTYDAAASPAFLTGLVTDLGMIAELADERGKISAFTEFGISGGVQPDGQNQNTSWYTDVLNAIMADPEASRSAYMLTWANFGESTTPYTPTSGEMLPDFLQYYDDARTLFASDLPDVYDVSTDAAAAAPTAHLASPADGARVATSPTTLRASVRGYDADRVYVTVDDAVAEVELTAPAAGGLWWTGTWSVPAELLDNSTHTLTLHVVAGGTEVATRTSTVVTGERPQLAPGTVDDFEGYGDDTALRTEYTQIGANAIGLARAADGAAVGGGTQALRFDYSFATQSYTGVGKQVAADWSDFWDFQLWVDPDASNNKLVLQLVADGVSFEAYPSLAGDDPYLATIPFADWRPAPWDTAHADRRLTPETLAEVTAFNIYVNAVDGGAASGSVSLDELRAVPGTPPPTTYADVPREAADYAAIEWLHGVYDLGDKNGRFHPTRAVSADELRAVFAAYDAAAAAPAGTSRLDLAVALWQLAGSPEPGAAHAFRDVPDAATAAVSWAVDAGVMAAASATRFGAAPRVDRAELARSLFATDAVRVDTAPVVISDFTSGADGWNIASWETNGGTASATGGRLVVDPGAGGDWVSRSGGLDLSGRTQLLLDVSSTTGFDTKAALQLGPDWTWCETAQAGWVSGAHTGADAVVIDLTTLSADCQALLGDVRGINVYLNEGHHELDAVSVR